MHTDTVGGVEDQYVKILDGSTGGTSSATVTAAGALKVDGSGVNQPVDLSTGVQVNTGNKFLSVEFSTGVKVNGTVGIFEPQVLGATVTYNGTQIISILQPTVLGATVTFNGAQAVTGSFFQALQPVSLTQPTVVGATTTYNGTQIVGVVQPTVLGATVTFNGAQSVTGSTVAVLSATLSTITGVLNSATAIVSSTYTPVFNTAIFTIWPGTSTGMSVVFETSQDAAVTWQGLNAVQNGGNSTEIVGSTFTLSTTTTTWQVNIAGTTNFRVRSTAWTAGFSSVTIQISALETVPLTNVTGSTVTVNGIVIDTTGSKWLDLQLSTGVQVNTGSKFLGVELSTGVQVNTGSKFLSLELSTGVQVNQGTPGVVDWPVRVSTVVINTGVKFLNVELSTGVQVNTASKFLGVELSTGVQVNTASKFLGLELSTGVQVNTGNKWLNVEASTGLPVGGMAANNAAEAGNPLQIGVEVTSNTLPATDATTANGKIVYLSGDGDGRMMTTGMPYGVISTTYSVVISSSINNVGGLQAVYITSPSANTSIYLCGCIFTNTTATANSVRITSPPGTVSTNALIGSQIMDIGVPASFVPSGVWPGCSQPFFRGASGSSISFIETQVASTQSISLYCQYYTGRP